MNKILRKLKKDFQGEIFTDDIHKIAYSTDASSYKQTPFGVAFPKTKNDIILLIDFAKKANISLIPRGAGTSLAGQVVGEGLVVDCSKYFNRIIEINEKESWVIVAPGVVLDELNNRLKPYNLFFAPQTSTSNRCTIGGMVGNNSCGSYSLVYGSTKDHIISSKVILADGKEAIFSPIVSKEEFLEKTKLISLEGEIYRYINETYSKKEIQKNIEEEFPDKEIRRRNNGYALDELVNNIVFDEKSDKPFNLSRLFSSSEGTLGFATEFKLHLSPLPPQNTALICAHFHSLEESFEGNIVALRHNPRAVELMDDNILSSAKRNIEQKDNMFFVQGSPKAILIIELAEESKECLEEKINAIIGQLKQENLGFAFPIIEKENIKRVWDLRKAGLGLLTNIPGSKKPVSVIEDTAISVYKLKDYIKEFQQILKKYNLSCVYHAHIATGELHLRPVLDLKNKEDVVLFRQISLDIAKLVKKYRGSLSGEHGDGRLRGEFIPLMYGDKVYNLMKEIKTLFDPNNIFNKGKIIDTPPMDTFLRYSFDKKQKEREKTFKNIRTYYDFSKEEGLLSAVEQCNGSADCRKSEEFLNTMCPSFRATKNELFTPRARANLLREYFINSPKENPFDNENLYWILDNCLQCKGCKRECPSNVDISKIKSEFLQHYYNVNGVPLNIILINNLTLFQRIGSLFPKGYNFFMNNPFSSLLIKKILKFAPQRRLPLLNEKTLGQLFQKSILKGEISSEKTFNNRNIKYKKTIYFFFDEFSSYQDSLIAHKAILLLNSLGYIVKKAPIRESGRISFSKGMIRRAKRLVNRNISNLKEIITKDTPLIGIEPSTILSFRDEYPLLLYKKNKDEKTKQVLDNAFLFDEFLSLEADIGNIRSEDFTKRKENILLHGHCQQKALIGTKFMEKILSLPKNYTIQTIPSGCCGMAGSFGYEKKHYELSKTIGSQILFPAINNAKEDVIISAPGTSCREHIYHFTNKKPLHPIEILYNAREEKLVV
ncbi:MAG: FAD-binding protein [Bacteroidales bacterium]|jgi:FAD/FMN-containing dehydrogenase/Fe-S oxidoreductase|nr:FAD-binding protein [Bacteroidales bacterium]